MLKCLRIWMFSMIAVCLLAMGANAQALSSGTMWDTLQEAYIYALPLVMTNATMRSSTNTVTAGNGKAPVGQLNHAKKLADASFRTVVTPNVDTVYSQAWLDLSKGPMIFVMPEADRFFNMQILDAWTNTAAVLSEPGVYAIAKPDYQGELPEGAVRVDVSTDTVWMIGRIVLSGEADLPEVYAIQDGMKLAPLSAWLRGEEDAAPEGTYVQENDFVPSEMVLSMDMKTFFDTANRLMDSNPPAREDADILKNLQKVNVGPGLVFDEMIFEENAREQWKERLGAIRAGLNVTAAQYAVKMGQWMYYGEPIGDFGTAYDYRALVALVGLGANPVDVAIYPKTDTDADGAVLTGEKDYILHFDTFPPVKEGGFWSVTAYGSDNFLIDNPLDRYCINDRSALHCNDDGSADILLSRQMPEDTDNYLPVSEGEFHLFMRIYLPDMDAVESWKAPTIRVMEE